MNDFKNVCILFGVLALILIVSHIEFRDLQEQERERAEYSEHRMARECAKTQQWATRDSTGRLVCTDTAPAWSMSSPIRAGK